MPADAPGRRGDLLAALRRIDGWGPLAWREVHGRWRLRGCILRIEPWDPAAGADGARDPLACRLDLPAPVPADPADDVAVADHVLRRAAAALWPAAAAVGARCISLAPSAAVRPTTACRVDREDDGQGNLSPLRTTADADGPPALRLRFLLTPPSAGMCIDAAPFRRFIAVVERFAAGCAADRGWRAHARAVRVQRALRAALPAHGLVAFLGDGARIARTADDRPDPACRPLRAPARAAVAIDLGRLGRVRGLGIPAGVTALIGAPYHGKSTLLAAIAAGADDHPPGDGRERVVALPAWPVEADDGRPIKRTDMRAFFARLPGGDAAAFATARASGATSMAAGMLHAMAAGGRLALIDEDRAAANFLAIDPTMRRLLGRDLDGHATLVERLDAIAAGGLSTVIVAGAAAAPLAAASLILRLRDFAVQVVARRRLPRAAPLHHDRRLDADGEALYRRRNTVDLRADEPDRPWLDDLRVDLRRSGFALDAGLARGALLAAAWCCRHGAGGTMAAIGARYAALTDAAVLDPYEQTLIALPPWPLVVAVLERLPRPGIASVAAAAG